MGVCCVGCCFNSSQNKALEIGLIALNSFSIVLILLSLIVINWKELYGSNLAFFIIMLIICIICLILSIFIRYWSSIDLLKTSKKTSGTYLCYASIALGGILYALNVIEEIIFSISFHRANHPCRNFDYTSLFRRISSDYDCKNENKKFSINIIKLKDYFMAYATFSYLEIAVIVKLLIWCVLKTKIKRYSGTSPNIPNVNIQPQNQMYSSPYGGTVVVVQQPYQVQYQQPYYYNQQVQQIQGVSNYSPSNDNFK